MPGYFSCTGHTRGCAVTLIAEKKAASALVVEISKPATNIPVARTSVKRGLIPLSNI